MTTDERGSLDALRHAVAEALASLAPVPPLAIAGGSTRLLAQVAPPASAAPRRGGAGVRSGAPGDQRRPAHDEPPGDHDQAVSSADDEADRRRLIALVELARSGDKEAFGLLYDHYQPSVHRYLYYRLGTVQLAEDLTGETFFRALRSMNNFRWQGRDFGAWLMTIARNLVADHYKSGRTRLEQTTEDLGDLDSATGGPEDLVLDQLTNEELLKALHELPRDQQDCLVMRFLQGMSLAETADALDRSCGAIKQLQLRAVRNLAALLPEGWASDVRNLPPLGVVVSVMGLGRRAPYVARQRASERGEPMTVLLSPSRRRAERFAALLDRDLSEGAGDPRLDEALATVATLRRVADTAPAPRADYVADLRSRLMAEADTALVATDQRLFLPDRSTTGRRQGRAAAVVAALVIVGGSAGISVAAENSLPGESLYSVKRGIENTHEALSFSDAAQGRVRLAQATTRLGEARKLAALGESKEAAATIDQFASSAGAGADLLFRDYQTHPDVAAVTGVREFAGTSMGDLDALAADAPASMRPSLVAAAQLLADLDQQARVLCAACGARSPLTAPSDLALASAPGLEQLLVEPSAAAPADVGTTTSGEPAIAGAPVSVPALGNAVEGATTSGPTTPSGSAPADGSPVKKPAAASPTKLPSLPSTVTTVTDGLGQAVAGTVDGLTSTVNGLTNLTGLTPNPSPTPNP